jgi:hypothetical protein
MSNLSTYLPSTSSNRRSTGQHPQPFGADILRRVDVSVMDRPTVGARPRSNIKRHLVRYRTTLRASFARREPPINLNDSLPSPSSLVFQKPDQRGPSGIGYRLGEVVVLGHSLDVQRFEDDHLVFVDQSTAEFVKVIAAGVRDTLMYPCDKLPCFVARLRSFFLSREFALFALQIPFGLPKVTRISELRSVASDGEMRQPNINADNLSIGRYIREVFPIVSQDRRVKLSARIPADRDRLKFTNDITVDNTLHPTDLRQIDAAFVDLYPLWIGYRLPPMLRLEPGIFSSFGEEVFVCARKMLQRLLQYLSVCLFQPLEFVLQGRKPNRHRMVVQPFPSFPVKILGNREGIIPRPPSTTKLDSKLLRLLLGRVDSDARRGEHELDILCVVSNHNKERTPYIPGLKAEVLRLN